MTHDSDLKRLVRERMARTGQTYTAARAALLASPAPTPTPTPTPTPEPHDPAYERTLRTFVRGERLTAIPARRKARAAVLLHLLTRFEAGRDYPEAEVNAILRAAHEDYAWLRRELVNYRYLTRSDGVYRVAEAVPRRNASEAQEVPAHEAEVIAALQARDNRPRAV